MVNSLPQLKGLTKKEALKIWEGIKDETKDWRKRKIAESLMEDQTLNWKNLALIRMFDDLEMPDADWIEIEGEDD